MKKVNFKNPQQNLHHIFKNAWAKLQDQAAKPVTPEDITMAKVEIIETEIATVIHQTEVEITSPNGKIIVPVYLDENSEWFIKKDQFIPSLNNNSEKQCLKILLPENSQKNEKLVVCYPLEDVIDELIPNAIMLLQSDLQIVKKDSGSKAVHPVLKLPHFISNN